MINKFLVYYLCHLLASGEGIVMYSFLIMVCVRQTIHTAFYGHSPGKPKISWFTPLQDVLKLEVLQAGCPSCHPANSVKTLRMTVFLTGDNMLPPCCQDRSGTLWWLCGLPCPPTSRELPSYGIDSVPDLETTCCHHDVIVNQEHCCGSSFYRPDALPVTRLTESKHWWQWPK